MKAMICSRYGSPGQLQLQEVPIPSPKPHEVLVKVRATAVNDYDWGMVRGKPYLYRLLFGLLKPKHPVPGMELAGTVAALGAGASSFKVGDAVYGDISEHGFGSFAEYCCTHEKTLVLKPGSMGFEEATAIPHATMLAYQGLVDMGKIKEGQNVLINGAGGGVGTFGLQLAKLYGARVTGVDTGDKLNMMQTLGFDHIIDYKTLDFTRNAQRYDLILDAKTNRSPFAYLRSLKPSGTYVTVGGSVGRLLLLFLLKGSIYRFSNKRMHVLALKPNKDLAYMNELFNAGRLKPVLDGPYPLEKLPWALQYFGEGKHRGKVIIKMPT